MSLVISPSRRLFLVIVVGTSLSLHPGALNDLFFAKRCFSGSYDSTHWPIATGSFIDLLTHYLFSLTYFSI